MHISGDRSVISGQKLHNATLDGLRGVAACTVVWFHMIGQTYQVASPFHGYLAVDFFFILSGFVIARSYEARLAAGMTMAAFIKLRLIRLYPLILLGLILGAISKYVGLHSHINGILFAFLFGLLLIPYSGLHVPGGRSLFPLDVPLWSLLLEIWANIFFAAAVKLRVSREFVFMALGLGAVGVIFFAAREAGLLGGAGFNDYGAGIARVSFAFPAGICLHWLLTADRVQRLPNIPFPILAVALLLVLIPPPGLGGSYDIVAVTLIFPLIVTLGIRDTAFGRMRSLALFSGSISYPIYDLHDASFIHFSHFRGHSLKVTLAAWIVAFVAVFGLSYIALRWYDEPVRKWLGRQLRHPVRVPKKGSL
jgi:peptidoglycan/LPS O-acetylase OafA/YrhL